MKEEQNKINRRSFLKTVGAAGVGSVLASVKATAGPDEPNTIDAAAMTNTNPSLAAKSSAASKPSASARQLSCDVFVYGSTPGGIAAAVEAARRRCRVILASPKANPGGMAASGLCTTDAVRRDLFGGFVLEFISGVRKYYQSIFEHNQQQLSLTRDGWFYEPSVAEMVFRGILEEEEQIRRLSGCWLTGAEVADGRITEVYLDGPDGKAITITAKSFIDGTYEGDLAARAKVPYRVGREGRDEFGESRAGIHYMNWRTGGQIMTADTGEPSIAIQSFCYRGILTKEPKHRIPIEKPAAYDEHLQDYLPLLQDFKSGRVKTLRQVFPINPELPNQKFNYNGQIERLTSPNCPGISWAYPESDRHHRQRLDRFHRDHAAGLMWFLQHDKHVPEDIAADARQWGLHNKEFVDNEYWPWQLYVRQGRRIKGRAIVTQHNFTIEPRLGRTPKVEHPIALGEHSFDAHPCHDRRYAVEGFMEGVLWYPRKAAGPAQPGQIPYGAMLPKNIDNLLVPVAMSSTHIAMSVLRMEPVWMTTGQVAGLAAAVAMDKRMDVAQLDPTPLPKMLKIKTGP